MANQSGKYTLYYWPKDIAGCGRGEFVRLLFEAAKVDFEEIGDKELLVKMFKKEPNKQDGYPCLCPPMIVKGDFKLSQTGVICQYLGKEFGFYPDEAHDEWHAAQLNNTIHDYIGEGRLAFHGKDFFASYFTQQEETKPYIERFVRDRLPKFLTHFECALRANGGGSRFLVGKKLTYVDLGLLHVLRATEAQFTDAWSALDTIPLLKAFKMRLESRPELAEYFKSDRCRPFSDNSMM